MSNLPTPQNSWLAELGWAERFELLERIGSGGMGQVWRARERATDRIVALKTLDPSKSGDDHLLARLDIEAATLIKLRDAGQHEHIVPIIDFKVSDTHACLAMEFIPGLNLRKWCDTHQLTLTKRVELIAQVARATGWFHALDVIHRDLKPANILVSAATHQPVIVDFSIAKLDETAPLTLTNEALGTAPYMAPEQLDRALAPISPATDVYALGVTLYELLTHILPHPGELPQIIQRHQNEVRPARPSLINKDIPRDLESICLKALAHRPDDRYPNGEDFAADLDRYLTGEPVIARPMSPIAYFVRQARRRPAFSAAVSVSSLLLLVLTWGIWQATNERRGHELEAQLAVLMQAKTWSEGTLQKADSLLAELAADDMEKSNTLKRTVTSDVIEDIEAALLQPYLKPDDPQWMQDQAVPWIQRHEPNEAHRLAELIAERLRRWKPVAILNPPFKDLGRVFGSITMRAEGELLFPDYTSIPSAKANDPRPSFWLAVGVPQPLQFNATFPTPVIKASGLHLTFEFQSVRSVIQVVAPRDASDDLLRIVGERQLDPNGLLLVGQRQGKIEDWHYYAKAKLNGTFFTLTVKLQGNQLDATINGEPGLHIEGLFAFASSTEQNRVGISWPRGLGLHELGIYTRPQETWNQMEMGDLLYTQGKWASAQGVYETFRSVPGFELEASYKTALSLAKQKQTEAALTAWELISNGPPSLWRDLSSYHLWVHAATQQGPVAARLYLQRLPEARLLAPAVRSLTALDRKRITLIYQTAGLGMNGLRNNVTEINEAVKALQIVGTAPAELASRFAMALHTCGLDDAARQLLGDSLGAPKKYLKDSTEQYAARLALDQWTRISRSEIDQSLHRDLNAWRKTYPADATLQAIGDQEDARVQARAGDYPSALQQVRKVHERTGVDPRQIISAWLLEGMIQRLLGHEDEAQDSWRQGIEAASAVTQRSALHLCDLIVLHSLSKTWNRETVTQVITQLMGRGKTGSSALSLQSAFVSSFLANDEFARSLNTIAEQPSNQSLAQHTALRTKTARELMHIWYAIIMERYFLSAAFPPDASIADQTRVQNTVEHLTEALAASQEGEEDFFAYIQAWMTPLMLQKIRESSQHYPRPLVARLTWLLAQRYLSTGHTNEAKGLLAEIKDDPSLDEEWRTDMIKQIP